MTIREEIERLRLEAGGIISPESLVAAAQPEDSPLHRCFEWDNTEAAKNWRVHQARNLLRVYVEVFSGDGKNREVRAYVSLTTDRVASGGYRAMGDVLEDSGLRERLLADAKEDMARFKKKYGLLQELATVFEAMEAVVKEPETA